MPVSLATRFTDRYQLEAPIAMAGMAFAGMTPPLGIAVCEAGAMGSIAGVGILPPPAVDALVSGVQAGTSRPFHVNFITRYTQDAHIDLMVDKKPAAVSFHWGHPRPAWIERLRAAGIDVWEQVGSVDDARRAVDEGIDLVVAQGMEAGGHNFSTAGTFALTPAVVDAVGDRALVLAAGGIVDGRGLAAALLLGADGAWMGTRFVATQESPVADAYKARLVEAGTSDTVRTHVFGRQDPQFNPIRVIRNRLVAQWHERIDEIPAGDSEPPVIGRMDMLGQPTPLERFTNLVPMTGAEGDFDELPLLAGEGVGLIDDLPPAAEVVASVREGALAALRARAGEG